MAASRFTRFADWVAVGIGKPKAFIIALGVTALWAATGPLMQYSDTWQLIINTSTTILTFLFLFLLQHTQNRDTARIMKLLEALQEEVDDEGT